MSARLPLKNASTYLLGKLKDTGNKLSKSAVEDDLQNEDGEHTKRSQRDAGPRLRTFQAQRLTSGITISPKLAGEASTLSSPNIKVDKAKAKRPRLR